MADAGCRWGVATFPLVPGHEIIGTVAQIGGVEGFELGQRVGIGVQRSSCGACDCCEASLEQLCPKITKTYGGPNKEKGGFARYIRYNAKWVFPLPESLSSELAGAKNGFPFAFPQCAVVFVPSLSWHINRLLDYEY
jgi:uncharacterized zinc-type alcohol dehydrogenase-like protein|eukprot:COSAG06_NODE_1623_length_8895_cov_86.951683_8_plen_137_part_00